ncbi:protein FAM234B isoform 1-T1 [Anomaloglossus baeobatrachus]|uniref:protein FAM234B isoform X1 n=1 Tax=Anomaloglossus baeobatrachus TaxID=238106 RepID=UPI003F504C18
MRSFTPLSMATVLSRALKLPGKKSHDPREYDPLTQADSDESEDDLVINIQQNGVQNGKGNRGASQDRDFDVEGISKRVQQRPVDSKQDGLSTSGDLDPELKPPSSLISYVRTTVFLLTVVISMIMVLICAFLIPCPMNGQHNMWTLHVGYDTEFSSPLELFDVNQDGVPDVLLTFLSSRINASQDVVKQRPFLSVLSGTSGSVVWSRHTQENLRSIQCGQLVIKQNDTCLLTGTYKLLSLITASTGESLWTMSLNHVSSGTVAAPAVILPDLDDDFTNDLLVLTIGESQPDLGFLLVSGRTGNPLGAIVKYSIMGEGKLLGPQAYYTSQGAIYILFGFGNIQAFALRDIYAQTKIGGNFPSALQRIDPDWEKKRSVNHSKLINVFSAGVEFLQTVPVYLSNFSDLLVTTKDSVALLSGQDLEQRWSINLNNIYSHPKPGYFNSDGSLDFFIQIQSNATEKKVIVIDGVTSGSLWEWAFPWHEHEKETEAMSLLTADGKSVFLFWGEGVVSGNGSQMPNKKPDVPWMRHLYLLCPTYPGVVLDLFNVSSSIVASAVGIREMEKDALLAILTAEQEQSPSGIISRNLTVTKVGMRWALSSSRAVPLRGANIRPKVEDIKKILTRLKFSSLPQRVSKK